MVWGAITSTGLSDLHLVPEKTSITGPYYQENILEKHLLPMFDKTEDTGCITRGKLLHPMSEMIFMQDGARCHTASTTTQLLEDRQVYLWTKK